MILALPLPDHIETSSPLPNIHTTAPAAYPLPPQRLVRPLSCRIPPFPSLSSSSHNYKLPEPQDLDRASLRGLCTSKRNAAQIRQFTVCCPPLSKAGPAVGMIKRGIILSSNLDYSTRLKKTRAGGPPRIRNNHTSRQDVAVIISYLSLISKLTPIISLLLLLLLPCLGKGLNHSSHTQPSQLCFQPSITLTKPII